MEATLAVFLSIGRCSFFGLSGLVVGDERKGIEEVKRDIIAAVYLLLWYKNDE